ncbi:protein MpBHLH4 [Marchantia polymorpha subsp. ruderalis]|nr:hypothetical protein MARPO_0028s0058 [Marchantia polymorpha]BBN00655.1 hypothetical protein Mp_2g00930 [Marchantia polymorpha subsp. ruderalis]|eukprot:PTQ42741.1 hypothetical protein MARPO_0028s0058 [Marchantia polymorpha]
MGQGEQLRELVRSMGWSYAVLWSIPPLMTELVWTDGWYEASNLKVNVERLFNSSYKTCSFAPGYGYVGKVFTQGQHIWVTGDAVHRQSTTSGQATFFSSAGIQTLLCFPWFNGVVELGAEGLVPQNDDLLQQIRRFLSNTPASKLQQQQQHLRGIPAGDDSCHSSRFSSLSPSQGPLTSQGLSSDDAEGGGLSDTTLNQPVDSCPSLSMEDRIMRQHFRLTAMSGIDSSCYWAQGPAAVDAEILLPAKSSSMSQVTGAAAGGLHHQGAHSGITGMIGADWRLDFGSDIHQLTSSPTSTLQQAVFTPLPGTEHEEFESSSFLVASSQLNQTAKSLYQQQQHLQQMAAKSPTSSGVEISSNQQQHLRGFLSTKKTGTPAFKPWKGQKQVIGVKRQKSQSNQVLLQRSIKMVHQISLLNQKKDEKKRTEQMALAMRRAPTEAREYHSCHDEAAINHMLAERKRREKQKENFSALRALIPFVSKTDRASILGDAIQYVKQLRSRVQELESINRELEAQIPNSQRKPNSSV